MCYRNKLGAAPASREMSHLCYNRGFAFCIALSRLGLMGRDGGLGQLSIAGIPLNLSAALKMTHPHTLGGPVSKSSAKKPLQLPSMRRVCRIVADKHGNTSTEWVDAPPDFSCPTVELKRLETGLSLEPEKAEQPEVAYDPYSNPTDGTRKRANRKRTNLRELSDWIKTVRETKRAKAVTSNED